MRYRYRRVHVLLRREGWTVNPERMYRLYKEMGLQIYNKVPRCRVKSELRGDRGAVTQANQTWADLAKARRRARWNAGGGYGLLA